MKKIVLAAAAFALCAAATAKLPALDDAAKAKAAETAAKQAWQAKLDAFQLCKAQDRVAARYKKTAGAKTAGASAPMAVAAATSPTAAASAAPTTPVAYSMPANCADPGVFAYNPPEQKPLETSGAHSPSGTAASPPSVRPESEKMTSGKKS